MMISVYNGYWKNTKSVMNVSKKRFKCSSVIFCKMNKYVSDWIPIDVSSVLTSDVHHSYYYIYSGQRKSPTKI